MPTVLKIDLGRFYPPELMVVFINHSLPVRATAYVLRLLNWSWVSGAAKAFAEGWGDLADAEAHGQTWEHLGLKWFEASTEWISIDCGYLTYSRRSAAGAARTRIKELRHFVLPRVMWSRGTNGHVVAQTMRFRASKPTLVFSWFYMHLPGEQKQHRYLHPFPAP